MFVEFVILNPYLSFALEDFAQILRIPCEGACVFSDRWSLDELVYGAPSKGPYQTNLPFPDDIISFIRDDREERKLIKDRGMRRGHHSTSSSTFNEPSSSHLNDDDDDDGNNKRTSRANVPPKPLNSQPLQSHPSLDITRSLSPITPLDHIHDTSSPPSPPQPQPPIMGHPLFYNYHDYHGSSCICCSHNRNLFFTLREEMNIMFAHLEYLLTTSITSHFPPPP
nr:pentatricopeptide repeat-containing protein [Tanacetum cinerariifolium]